MYPLAKKVQVLCPVTKNMMKVDMRPKEIGAGLHE